VVCALSVIHQIRLQENLAGVTSSADRECLRFRSPDGDFFVLERELEQLRQAGHALSTIATYAESELPVRFCLPSDGSVAALPPLGARLSVLARLLAEQRADGSVDVRFLGRHRTVPADGFVLDQASGGRRYVWQIVAASKLEGGTEIGERYRELHATLCDPDTRVVLSLGSGGLKLFGHAPVLRLLERIGCAEAVDEMWGTSAGALVALLYSHGLSPEAIEQTGYDLYGGRYQLSLRPTTLHVLRTILKDALLPSRGMSNAGFVNCAQSLSRMLDQYCSDIQPARPLFVLAFNLERGCGEVLSAHEVPEHLRGFMHHADPREATLASCAVPLLFMPHRVVRDSKETLYIDGSTTEDVPLRSVVRKWDLDRAAGIERRRRLVILYVKLSQSGSRHAVSTGGRGGKLRLLQAVAAVGMETIHARDLELLSLRDDVELLALHLPDSNTEFFEISHIPEYIRRANESFPEQLDALEQRLRERRR